MTRGLCNAHAELPPGDGTPRKLVSLSTWSVETPEDTLGHRVFQWLKLRQVSEADLRGVLL